jgi:hypothetical protein
MSVLDQSIDRICTTHMIKSHSKQTSLQIQNIAIQRPSEKIPNLIPPHSLFMWRRSWLDDTNAVVTMLNRRIKRGVVICSRQSCVTSIDDLVTPGQPRKGIDFKDRHGRSRVAVRARRISRCLWLLSWWSMSLSFFLWKGRPSSFFRLYISNDTIMRMT